MTSSSEIAGQLDSTRWETVSKGVAYPGPQTRVTICVEHNNPDLAELGALVERVGACDPAQDARQFAEDFVAALGDQLSPTVLQALLQVLGARFISAGRGANTPERMESVFDTFEGLLDEATRRG